MVSTEIRDKKLKDLLETFREEIREEVIESLTMDIEQAFNGEELLWGDWLKIKENWETNREG